MPDPRFLNADQPEKPVDPPTFTCDWGHCNEESVDSRWAPDLREWLGVLTARVSLNHDQPSLPARLHRRVADPWTTKVDGDLMEQAAEEIERLQHWKHEATAVLTLVDGAWERAGCPGGLGQQKWDAMAAEIARLRQVVTDQEHQIARLRGGA